jgi:hypothetical protein
MGKQGVNLTMTTPASTITWQSADCVHSTMHAELVPTDLLFMAARAVGCRADIGMVCRVGGNMAVQASQKAVYRPGKWLRIHFVTVETDRNLGLLGSKR